MMAEWIGSGLAWRPVWRRRRRFVTGLRPDGFHRCHYIDQGPAKARRVAVCVHGLSHNSLLFSPLAQALARRGWRVVCPDIVGRGRSDWLADPSHYNFPQYLGDLNALLARLDVPAVHWIGTSMGGLLGMILAAQPGSPILSLVLNDVGPLVPAGAMRRIARMIGADPLFRDLETFTVALTRSRGSFALMTESDWRQVGQALSARRPDGRIGFAFDPAIARSFAASAGQAVDLWSFYDRITCPTLTLRGAESDVLDAATAREMQERGPHATVVEIAATGHAPWLRHRHELTPILRFLHRLTRRTK